MTNTKIFTRGVGVKRFFRQARCARAVTMGVAACIHLASTRAVSTDSDLSRRGGHRRVERRSGRGESPSVD
jgi:hypothetical protein